MDFGFWIVDLDYGLKKLKTHRENTDKK